MTILEAFTKNLLSQKQINMEKYNQCQLVDKVPQYVFDIFFADFSKYFKSMKNGKEKKRNGNLSSQQSM